MPFREAVFLSFPVNRCIYAKALRGFLKGLSWWEEVDLNHRSRRRQIYSLIHLAALESSRIYKVLRIVGGAGDRN